MQHGLLFYVQIGVSITGICYSVFITLKPNKEQYKQHKVYLNNYRILLKLEFSVEVRST